MCIRGTVIHHVVTLVFGGSFDHIFYEIIFFFSLQTCSLLFFFNVFMSHCVVYNGALMCIQAPLCASRVPIMHLIVTLVHGGSYDHICYEFISFFSSQASSWCQPHGNICWKPKTSSMQYLQWDITNRTYIFIIVSTENCQVNNSLCMDSGYH